MLTPGGSALLQFWELDADHDFFICKEDLLRYGNHSLTYRIVDRIFSLVEPTHWCVRCRVTGMQAAPLLPYAKTMHISLCPRLPARLQARWTERWAMRTLYTSY